MRDEYLKAEITRVWKENYEVYGADKVWLELNRQGITLARCTTERLNARAGPAGRAPWPRGTHHRAGQEREPGR